MIIGVHSIIYSRKAEEDRAFLRDVLGFSGVDAGEGWLIYGLPPGEVAVHPGDENDVHELYLMVDDVEAFAAAMKDRGVTCGPLLNRGWGILTEVALPGGGKLGVYQPRHARPKPMRAAGPKPRRSAPKRRARKPAKRAGRTRSGKARRRR